VEVRATDAPPTGVSSIVVTVKNIQVHKADAPESTWITVVKQEKTFDLVTIQGAEVFLGEAEVAAGRYTQVRLDVTEVMVTLEGKEIPAKLPSGKLKLVRSWQVEPGKKTIITLDFEADKFVVITGKGQAQVKPVIKLQVSQGERPLKTPAPEPTPPPPTPPLSLSSTAFQDGEKIPAKYACDGQDVSPPLAWSEPPQGTQAFALIMDDPDAPGRVFTHWVLFNLPADSRQLSEAIPAEAQLTNGALQGKNDFRKSGYGGPCPPPGHPHRYQFTLYALDQPLDLEAGASKKQLLSAMQGHILAQVLLTGTYQR